MAIQKIRSGRVGSIPVTEFIGDTGAIFYDEAIGDLRLSDGYTPGGKIVSPINLAVTGNLLVNSLLAADAVITGNLTVGGYTALIDVEHLRIVDPVIEQGGSLVGSLTINDGQDRGQLLHYYANGVHTDAFIGLQNATGKFIIAHDVGIANNVITVNSYAEVRAETFIGNVDAWSMSVTTLDVLGDLTVGGNTALGNQTQDTISVVAEFTSNLVPQTDLSYNLGSDSARWKTLYANSMDVNGIATMNDHRITNLALPYSQSDAVTKDYADYIDGGNF
jgi:hypothetical protein